MLKTEHRQISILNELDTIRKIAHDLRTHGIDDSVCDEAASLLTADKGPAPLVELFNWSHTKADADPLWKPARDTLNELIRLCARISRHCKALGMRGDQALDPFDELEVALRLEHLVTSSVHFAKHLHQ